MGVWHLEALRSGIFAMFSRFLPSLAVDVTSVVGS